MSKARPSSAQSRQAWGDYGHARPDSQFDFGQDGIRDDPDLSPTAMEDDYMNNSKGKSNAAVPATSTKQSKSFLSKIGSGVRSLWATRQTEDVKGDRELHVKTTLRELIVYLVFLVILCVVTFGMTTTTMYYYTKVMSDLFLDTTHSSGGTFRTITSVEDFWKFAKGPLIKGLYWETWYNNQTVPTDQLGYIYYENKLLGVPRIRQLQVHSNSCVVHDDFISVIRECYEAYAESLENKDPFGDQDNHTGWYYQSEDALDGSSHWGLLTTYSGAGYVEDLTQNKTESETTINYLFDKRWIVRGTRVVFIDFTVYNANINLFCVVRLTVEFPPTGGAIPHATLRTVKLIRYVTVTDYFIMACEFIFCLFIIYYMIEEAIEIKKHKCSYFKSFWNILDILVIAIAIVCVAFNVYRTLKVEELLSDLLKKPDQYADFEFLSYGQTQFDNAIAIAVFLAWIKIFKYISFNKTMTQLSSTLGKCAKDLAGFAVMFFIIFLAFTQLGYLLFGTQVKDFSNFQNSFFTLFRIILGDFDFEQLEQANRVLGPIFFMLFVFFVFFVLINMFLAIINDTYSEVKGDMANQKNEFEMTDYFKRGYEKVISKLNFKHDKIVDIQKALQSADINNDKQLDFDEWRTDLKMRGYADCEIEALFARYDTDGDRVLDEEEQHKMQADLAAQKNALNKEYDELEKIQRPDSARRSNSKLSFNDDSGEDTDDEDSHTKSSRSGPSQSVSYEEFTVLSRRVDRMEHSIGSIVSKIDAVLVKLEAMEKAKLKRRETMGKILDSITESDGTSDEVKREQMERLVREELERWDSESSITPQPSGRGASPSSSGRGGARSRSRPGSGGNAFSDRGQSSEDEKSDSWLPSIKRGRATIKVDSVSKPRKLSRKSKKKKLEIEVVEKTDFDLPGAHTAAHSKTGLLEAKVSVLDEQTNTSLISDNFSSNSKDEDTDSVSRFEKNISEPYAHSQENCIETFVGKNTKVDEVCDIPADMSVEKSQHDTFVGKNTKIEEVCDIPADMSEEKSQHDTNLKCTSQVELQKDSDDKNLKENDSISEIIASLKAPVEQDFEYDDICMRAESSFETKTDDQKVVREETEDKDEVICNRTVLADTVEEADNVCMTATTFNDNLVSEYFSKNSSLSSEFEYSFTDSESVCLSEFFESEIDEDVSPSNEVSPPLISFKAKTKNNKAEGYKFNQAGNTPNISFRNVESNSFKSVGKSDMFKYESNHRTEPADQNLKPVEEENAKTMGTPNSFKPIEKSYMFKYESNHRTDVKPAEQSLKPVEEENAKTMATLSFAKDSHSSENVTFKGKSGIQDEHKHVLITDKGQHVSVGSLSKQFKARGDKQSTKKLVNVLVKRHADSNTNMKSKTHHTQEKPVTKQQSPIDKVEVYPQNASMDTNNAENKLNSKQDLTKSGAVEKQLNTSNKISNSNTDSISVEDSVSYPKQDIPDRPPSYVQKTNTNVLPALPPRVPKVQSDEISNTIALRKQDVPEKGTIQEMPKIHIASTSKAQNGLASDNHVEYPKMKTSQTKKKQNEKAEQDNLSLENHVLQDCMSMNITELSNASYKVNPVSLSNADSVSLTECKKVLSAYDSHRHLEPSCTQPTVCKSTERSHMAAQSGIKHNVTTSTTCLNPVKENSSEAVFV